MKKTIIIVITILIIIGLIFGIYCIVTNQKSEVTQAKECIKIEQMEYKNTVSNVKDANYEGKNKITEVAVGYNSELKYYSKDWKVPYIDIDSEDAIKVNAEIKENFEKYSEKFGNSIEGVEDKIGVEMKYATYQSNNILSVIFYIDCKVAESDGNTVNLFVYNFDLSTKKIVTFSEICKATQNTEEQVIEAIKKYDNSNQYELVQRDMFYINNDGKLCFGVSTSDDEAKENTISLRPDGVKIN